MPLLGAHMSIAGGLHLAFSRIQEVRGEALQIFTSNQRQWRAAPLTLEMVTTFREQWSKNKYMVVAAHDSYLINLAAPESDQLDKSIIAFSEELKRAAELGIPFLITHPGSHLGQGLDAGLERFVANLDLAISRSEVTEVTVLIETTAGQGSNLGSSFEEIAFILSQSIYGENLGVCFDTSHVFAAGYDLRTQETYDTTFSHFHRVVGLERLRFFHLNDSKRSLGSRVDRHEHIGKGEIGLRGFRLLLNDPRFQEHPMVLETPKGEDLKEDKKNLRVLRSLIA